MKTTDLPIKSTLYRAVDGTYTLRVAGPQGLAYPAAIAKGATIEEVNASVREQMAGPDNISETDPA